MTAIAALLETLPGESIVVAPRICYFGVSRLLTDRVEAGRLVVRRVDTTVPDVVFAALEGASPLWLESPTNPLLGVVDLRSLIEAASSRGVPTVVDNTLATPLRQRPLSFGANAVVHSATKFIGGHSDLLLGASCRRTRRSRTRSSTDGAPTVGSRALRRFPRPARASNARRTTGSSRIECDRACRTATLSSSRRARPLPGPPGASWTRHREYAVERAGCGALFRDRWHGS
jgi:cystathionine gamma-synthase